MRRSSSERVTILASDALKPEEIDVDPRPMNSLIAARRCGMKQATAKRPMMTLSASSPKLKPSWPRPQEKR